MSGFFASAIISYGKSAKNTLRVCRHLVVPNLRMQPNVTQSSFKMNFCALPAKLKIDGKVYAELPRESAVKGTLSVTSDMGALQVTRIFSPAVHAPALLEKVILHNDSDSPRTVSVQEVRKIKKFPQSICVGQPIRAVGALCFGESFTEKTPEKENAFTLNKGESAAFYAVYYAVPESDSFSAYPMRRHHQNTDDRGEPRGKDRAENIHLQWEDKYIVEQKKECGKYGGKAKGLCIDAVGISLLLSKHDGKQCCSAHSEHQSAAVYQIVNGDCQI